MNKLYKTGLYRCIALIAALILAFSIFIVSLPAAKSAQAEENSNTITWTPRHASKKEFYDAEMALNKEMCEEGFVLLKNEDNFLPMGKKEDGSKQKISIFGKNSKRHAYFGYGSSDTSLCGADGDGNYWTEKSITIPQAFRESDTFEINEELASFYDDDSRSGVGRLNGDIYASIDGSRMGLSSGETPVANYGTVTDSFDDYGDAAIVLITRVGAEGSDLPKTSLKSWDKLDDSNKLDSARHWDDHYLQLDKYEVEMMQMVLENFDNVIVLLNTNAQFECGFLDDPNHYLYTDNNFAATDEEKEAAMNKIKAALYIGFTGTNGARAIPTILDGTVNPSGHLADTWMRDFKKDPTWQNQGYGENPDNIKWGDYFVHYEEDIYLGYRYYETRYITEDENTRDAWYKESVVYPFGFGLSYTEFEWSDIEMTSSSGDELAKDGEITASVTVTNTGNVAGKDVVQLYYSAPYYTGGISKAHVNLVQFAKTDLLQPGESQTLTMTFDVDDMKSYDFSDANGNSAKCYELEQGTYYITAASDAHEAAKLAENRTVSFTVPEGGFIYDKDPDTGGDVHNRFDDVGGTQKSGNRANNTDTTGFKGVDTYMSRDDFEGTFPTHSETKKNGPLQGKQQYTINEEYDSDKPWHSDEEFPNQAKTPGDYETNQIKLWHMTGRSLDDPMWDKLLDQLTPKEMAELIGQCVYYTIAIPSIDKPFTKENDGPLGNRFCTSIQWQSAPISAQTFNRELTYQQGLLMGEGCYYPVDGRQGGTYGPGLETHRSPFGGRNMEYYSEDPVLGGYMCAPFMKGTWEMGSFQLIKHFVLNNCETERNSISTWASEQAIREIYCKAYEIVVKDGNCMGFMSAVSYIGDMPCTTSYELLTGLLREEWGFEGMVISDMLTQDVELAIRAGNDLMLTGNAQNEPRVSEAWLTSTQLSCIRRAAKNILYVVANSFVMNGYGGESLDNIEYGGTNVIYAVEGVDNELSVDTASYKVESPYDIEYELTEGSLPAGMTMSADGTLSGAPAVADTYSFSVTASEKADEGVMFPYQPVEKEYKLVVFEPDNLPDEIIYNENSLGVLTYGAQYSKDIASGMYFGDDGTMRSDIDYELAPGNVLPKGLTLSADGLISGTVLEEPGEFFFSIIASAEGKQSKTINYVATIDRNMLSYTKVDLPDVTVGSGVNVDLGTAVSSSGRNVKYAVKAGDSLPEGLDLTPTGILSGTPTRAYDDYSFTVVVSSANAESLEVEYSMNIWGLVSDDVHYEDLLVGRAYSFKLSAHVNDGNADAGNASFVLKDMPNNSLPTGFRLLSDGTLIGVARDLGDVSFVVTATLNGYQPTDLVVTMSMYDIYGDELDGNASDPIDYDAIGSDTSAGCAGSTFGAAFPAAIILAGIAVCMVIYTRKNNKKEE